MEAIQLTNKKPGSRIKFPGKKVIIIVISVLLFLAIAIFAYFRISSYTVRSQQFDENGESTNVCTNILNPDCWTEAFKPQLLQTNGTTSVLIIGVDTRSNGALMNTDSIMILSYNHATKKTMLTSVPRDLFSFNYHDRINTVYAYTYNRDKTDRFKYLKSELTDMTGLPIQYVATVKFDGVIDLVNSIGGIEVCPYVNQEFVAKYPNPKATRTSSEQWLYYTFTQGCQTLDGEKALVYARFRHLRRGPQELAIDYSRVRRQQEVVNAVKDKLLGQDKSLQEKVEYWWQILQTIDKSVTYTFTFEDFLAGMSLVNDADKTPASVVLDPYFGGLNRYIYGTMIDGKSVAAFRGNSYTGIRNEVQGIWNNIDFYKEKPKILVLNMTGQDLAKDNPITVLKSTSKYYASFNINKVDANAKITKMMIFDFSGGKKLGSLSLIKDKLGISEISTQPELYDIAQSSAKEDILIIVPPVALTVTP